MNTWKAVSGTQALAAVVISMLACGISLADSPNLSPPALLPGDEELSPAAGLQEQPAIAMGEEYSLAVWTDARSAVVSLSTFTGGPFLLPGTGTMRDIYAARIDAAGNLVDAIPIVVNSGNLNQGFPAVAWNGQNWLVVWMGQSGLACCANINIYATRVSPEGTVLDNPPIVIDTDPTTSGLYWPCVASDGSNWAVAWRDLDQQAGIFTLDGARVSSEGIVLDPGGKSLRHDTWNSYPIGPQLAFAGDEYLLVWNENSDEVKAQRLNSNLDRIGGVFRVNLLNPTSGKQPDVATDGSSFFVAWFEDRYYGWAQLYGARVSHTGQVLDPAGIPVSPVSGYTQFDPAVAWDGEQWIVAYNMQSVGFNDDLFTTRVSSSGQVLDPNGTVVGSGPAGQFQPDIAAIAGGGARLVWHTSEGFPVLKDDIFAVSISANATSGPVTCISLGAPRQRSPEFVSNGNGYLAVYLSETSGISRVVGQRIDASGAPIDQEPFEIASGTSFVRPSAAWDGTRYLVTWSVATESKVYSRRVASDGTLMDATPQLVMLGDAPDVAAMNEVFLVTATRAQNPHFRYPYAVRVRGNDGLPMDSQPVLLGSYFATHPSVARLGDRWLVAWQENPTHDDVHSNIAANFVDANGTAGAQFYVTSTSITIETEPCVAAATDAALILWANNPTGAYNDDVRARRILANGTLLDGNGINVSPAPGMQNQPAAAWNGSEYAVLFSDFRNDDPNGPYVGDVYGARVSGDGTLIDLDGFSVINEPAVPEMDPTTAATFNQTALGCAAFQIGSPYAAYRIGYRILNPSATGVHDGLEVADLGRVIVVPNPSDEAVTVTFYAGGRETASARVFDAQGRVVRSLRGDIAPSGTAHVTWDGRNVTGGRVAPGIYFVRASTGSGDRVAKVLRR